MKINRDFIPCITIEQFADDNNLVMGVHERRREIGESDRFYAHFQNCEVMGNGVLIGSFGNGATEEDAISDYAKTISLKRIVIDARGDDRREINVPRLKGSR